MQLFETETDRQAAAATFNQLADDLAASVRRLLEKAASEEDLRIGFEKLIENTCNLLDIKIEPQYEKSVLSGGRIDAMHGQLIIEYEAPRSFNSEAKIDHTFQQIVGYLEGVRKSVKDDLFRASSKPVGVGFDGERIFFVKAKAESYLEFETKDFKYQMTGPYLFNSAAACTFLTYIRSLKRKNLNNENLTLSFGTKSNIAAQCIYGLVEALREWDTKRRADTFFCEWKRLFGIVYGEPFQTIQSKDLEYLYDAFGLSKEVDIQQVLFALHTYYVLLIKFIAIEYLSIYETRIDSSFSNDLVHSDKSKFQDMLKRLEDGGEYSRFGIANYLEGDFFRWYLDAMWIGLEESIRETARELTQYEPATPTINPDANRDLLKELYQSLVPREVRHRLGEYYTPDWLAELMLDEVGYTGDTSKNLLDPSCGTGTFLVLAIRRAREFGLQHNEPPKETLKHILNRIWGFDLNPLAVIAARTNYLLALGNLISESDRIELRVYLADSVLWPEQLGQRQLGPAGGEIVPVPTSVQTFYIPRVWIKSDWLLKNAADSLERLVSMQTPVGEAIQVLKNEGLVFPPNQEIIEQFYEQLVTVEKEGRNGIWARFLKNMSAPVVAGRFDYVVGNPPWIRWDFLSQEYRQATLNLWKEYGLFSLFGYEGRLGGGKKDFSMLFTYAAVDHYLKDSGTLGFLITQEVFKSKGAGEGFRRFRLGKSGKFLKIIKAHDFASFQPFEDASNKSAAVVLKTGAETKYPVPYYVWTRLSQGHRVPVKMKYEDLKLILKKEKYEARPIREFNSSWQTINPKAPLLMNLKGKSCYKSIAGAYPSPYGVFWLEIDRVASNGNIYVRNLSELGKHKIESEYSQIEPEPVYPALRGKDIKRWKASPEIYILVVQDPERRRGYNIEWMRVTWTRTLGYLFMHRRILESRPLYIKFYNTDWDPFYSQFGISKDTFSSYKVVWKGMGNDLISCVVSTQKTPMGHKKVIPQHTTSFIPTNDESEAHFLCAILNSTPVRDYIKSFSAAGRGFGTPSVINHLALPKFEPDNALHKRLAELSLALHDLAARNELGGIRALEIEVDKAVRELFGETNINADEDQ